MMKNRSGIVVGIVALLAVTSGPAAADKLNGLTFEASTKSIQETESSNTASPKITFKIRDPLYVRAFFPDTLESTLHLTKTDYRVSVWLQFTGGPSTGWQRAKLWIPKDDFGKRYVDLEIIPDPKTAHAKYDEGNFQTLIGWAGWDDEAKAIVQSKQVTISIFKDPVFKAELPPINIDFSGANTKQLAKLSDEVASLGAGAFSKNLAIATAGMRDRALETKLASMWKRNNKDVTTVRIVVTSARWDIETDPGTNRPIARMVDVSIISKKKDGKCFSESVGVNEQYDGRKYGPPAFASTGQSERQVDCAKAFATK